MNCDKYDKVVVKEIQCSKCSAKFSNKPYVKNEVTFSDARSFLCPHCVLDSPISAGESTNVATGSSMMQLQPMDTEVEYCSLNRELICILFPGIVKNENKAIQCLGGIKGISQVYSQAQKKRLGLSFQPDNPFVKRIFGDLKKTAGVLLKIKIKKIKVNNEVQRKVISTDVVGRVNKTYRFESMCDFQYMPIYREASDEPLQCLIDKVIPSAHCNEDFLKEEAPLYIVPLYFTRSDRPINYAYTDKRYPESTSGVPSTDDDVHKKSRSERGTSLGHWWQFNLTDEFPSKPRDSYFKTRDAKYEFNPALRVEFKIMERCFEERPIWSLSLLRYETKLRLNSVKVLLPCLAVFNRGGPWRALWIRYGFDPRKEPSARIYQTLDFRLRHTAGVHQMVMTRDQVVHFKSADRVRIHKRKRTEPPPSEEMSEGAVLFRPGMMPSQRQIFYQLCDVKLPEVESLLAEEIPPDRVCHEKYGWLPPNAVDMCRDLVFKYVKQTALATHNADLKFDDDDGGSSDEDYQNSGDEITNDMDESMQ